MKFTNRKAAVLAVLALLMVAQIVFSGVAKLEQKPTTQGPVLSDQSQTSAPQEEPSDLMVGVIGPTAEEETEPTTGAFEVIEEVVEADLHLVYHSTVSTGDVQDVFDTDDNYGIDSKLVLSYTQERLNIFAEASADSEVLGVLYSGSEGELLELGETWSKIRSGEVTGYVYNANVLFGDEAEAIAGVIGQCAVTIAQDGTNVYATPDEEAALVATLNKADEITLCDRVDGYYMINCAAGFAYVPKSDVRITYGLKVAKTMEQIRKEAEEAERRAAEEARRRAEEAAKKQQAEAEAAKKNSGVPETTWRQAFSATEEEIHLLATIIYWESGWEPTAGQLAVANVVLNRILSPDFRVNTIEQVIYAPGQFTGVANNWQPTARFQSFLAMSNEELNRKGCYDVALRALAGENNIGDYCFFISVKSANYARYKKYCIINNHCFYDY